MAAAWLGVPGVGVIVGVQVVLESWEDGVAALPGKAVRFGEGPRDQQVR
jgi:hypothetical protein